MGQVNVNTPGGGTEPVGEPPGATGAGMIIGIIIAILVIVLLVYFLVIAPGGGGGGGGGGDGGDAEPQPTGWMLVERG